MQVFLFFLALCAMSAIGRHRFFSRISFLPVNASTLRLSGPSPHDRTNHIVFTYCKIRHAILKQNIGSGIQRFDSRVSRLLVPAA